MLRDLGTEAQGFQFPERKATKKTRASRQFSTWITVVHRRLGDHSLEHPVPRTPRRCSAQVRRRPPFSAGPPVPARLGTCEPHRRLCLGRRAKPIEKHRRIEVAANPGRRLPEGRGAFWICPLMSGSLTPIDGLRGAPQAPRPRGRRFRKNVPAPDRLAYDFEQIVW